MIGANISKYGWPLVVIALAAVIRLFAPLDPNIDWLISNCRALLHGAALYHDIVETNPPMAVFIYLPAALVEHWTGWAAEPVFTVMVLLAGTASAIFFSQSLIRNRWTLPVSLFVILVAPLSAFGEREHVAVILMLPLFGLLIRRADGRAPGWPEIILAGLLAGIAPMIKPYFALGIISACVWLAIRRRDVRGLFVPEALIAAVMTLTIAALVWLYLPAYPHEVLPLLMDVYAPLRRPLGDFIYSTNVRVCALSAIMLCLGLRGTPIRPAIGILLAGAVGFFIAFLIQGRGWPYHAYPAVALLMLAAALAVAEANTRQAKIYGWWAVGAALLNLVTYADFPGAGYGGVKLIMPIRVALSAPTVMSITSDLTPGHPITTDVGGTWAGTYSSRWITVNAGRLLARHPDNEIQARLVHWQAYDRQVTNSDIATRHPDIILVGIGAYDWQKWIAADAETAHLMANYRPLATDTLTSAQKGKYEPVMAYIRADLANGHPDQHTE